MKYTVASLLGSAALVAAHGYVDNATIGGEVYTFYQPYQDPYMNPAPERISRPIQGNGPIEDITSIDLQCGGNSAAGIKGSQPAKLEAKAQAGTNVTLNWTLWPDSHIGPTITYMAKCPDAGCTDYLPGTDAVWFKIQESGREGTSNTWGATPLMKAGNSGIKYTIPECLTPGHYLVRHEIIALHAAYSYPGAQFYPGCHQIEVTGSGSTSPSDLVAFPGAYSKTDPGIVYDAYKAQEYKVPGPAVFSCSGSGSGSGSAPVATSAAAASSAPAATTSATAVTQADVSTPTPSAADDDDDCPAESSAAPVATPTPTPTQAASGGDEDDCPAESSAAPVATPTPTPTQAASGGDEDDCPAETEAPVAAATATQAASGGDEDDCPAESSAAPVATPTPTPTQAASGGDEDDCPAETEAPVASATPTQAASGGDEDDCPAESSAAPVATPTPTPTQAASGGDEDDCPVETPVARRMSLHERRSA